MKQPFLKTAFLVQLFLLFAHLYNNRHGLPIPVIDAQSRLLVDLMQTYHIDFFGNSRTLNETIWGYDLTWALFTLFTIFISGYCILYKNLRLRTGKYITATNALLWLGCAITALIFWSWPQQLFFVSLVVLFSLSFLFDWRAPKPNNTRVCIIGAGISGLTVAYQLQKQGYQHITVLEKNKRIGGKCLTSDLEEQPFDLGGHEMLAGYKDLLQIADELNAPTRVSIPPLVYDHDKKQYLNFKEAATISGKYTMMQVMMASIKYLWLVATKFSHFSKPSSGYKNVPLELTMRLDKWLEKRKLTALTDILSFVIKVQGYGQFTDESAAHLVKFMGWRNWLSLILSGVGISKKWPRVMVLGMNNLCERMANTIFDIRTGVHVEKVLRDPSKKSGGIQIFWNAKDRMSLEADTNPMIFDKLVIALPPELPRILFLDITPEEQALFARINYYKFFSTVCKVQGLPAGVVASIPFNKIEEGEYTGYIKDYTPTPIATFFTLALKNRITGKVAIEKIKEVLSKVPPYKDVQPELLSVIEQKEWKYFPHFDVAATAEGAYNELEDLQGKNNTFYASSLLAFECVGNSAAYAKRLATTFF
jgi:predicted NAD/FAD-binding protein